MQGPLSLSFGFCQGLSLSLCHRYGGGGGGGLFALDGHTLSEDHSLSTSGPARQGATTCCHDCVPPCGEGLSGQHWAGPRLLGFRFHLGPGPLFKPVPSAHNTRPMGRAGPDWRATAPLSTVPVAASGTFNPLCRVLCILQSLYLCSIGPMLVFCLARDTPCTSNCSPKPLYSWMQAATPPATTHTQLRGGQYPSVVGHSRAFPGADGHRLALPPAPFAHSIC